MVQSFPDCTMTYNLLLHGYKVSPFVVFSKLGTAGFLGPLLVIYVVCSNFLACATCWSPCIDACLLKIPRYPFQVVARKTGLWTQKDVEERKEVQKIVENEVPGSMKSNTAFVANFPLFCRTVCSPDGFLHHSKTSNSNGKLMLSYLITSALGSAQSISPCFADVFRCGKKYFRVQSDPTTFRRTADVMVLGFETSENCPEFDIIRWMYDDSPRTPKLLIADAESGKLSLPTTLHNKKEALKSHMRVYSTSIHREPLVGLLLGEELMLHSFTLNTSGDLVPFAPLNQIDLSDINGVLNAMKNLNHYMHEAAAISMNEAVRQELPLVRSRSSSVCSSERSIPHYSPYNLRSVPHYSPYNLRPRATTDSSN